MITELWSVTRCLAHNAANHASGAALIWISATGTEETLSWTELDRASNQIARQLSECGVDDTLTLVLRCPNEPLVALTLLAAWKLGTTVLPLNPRSPEPECAALVELARQLKPALFLGETGNKTEGIPLERLAEYPSQDISPLPERSAQPAFVMASGGTSGRPKFIVEDAPSALPFRDGAFVTPRIWHALGARPGQVRLVCAPLFYMNGLASLQLSLMLGDTLVLCERFDAELVLNAIEQHRVQNTILVPSAAQRMIVAQEHRPRDLSSLEALAFGGSHCPEWVLRRWIDLLGPERVFFGYGATEPYGKAAIRGDDWLTHPGSVGRPVDCDVRIVDESGRICPTGTVGDLYMRPAGREQPAFRYLGAKYAGLTPDGFVSVGDFAWLDDDGYLYIADRRSDLIVSGGSNVYPMEIEDVLARHPAITAVAVIGVTDPEWGRRVHAVIEPRDPCRPPPQEELSDLCRRYLAPYKIPKTFEFVTALPLTDVGKVSRRHLKEERGDESA